MNYLANKFLNVQSIEPASNQPTTSFNDKVGSDHKSFWLQTTKCSRSGGDSRLPVVSSTRPSARGPHAVHLRSAAPVPAQALSPTRGCAGVRPPGRQSPLTLAAAPCHSPSVRELVPGRRPPVRSHRMQGHACVRPPGRPRPITLVAAPPTRPPCVPVKE